MDKTTRVAIEAATQAGKLLRRLVKQSHQEKTKGHAHDIVTEADIASNNLIAHIIHRSFPNHTILSEESSPTIDPKKHGHLWIVDPIDGTISFAAGLPFYTVSIAYAHDGEVVSSALFMADTNEVLWAQKGEGAYANKKPIHVKDLPWEKSVVGFDQSIRKRKIAMEKLAPPLSLEVRFLHMSAGQAYMTGQVAKGNFQGMLSVFPSVWDFAAGVHLVREAGGVVTDFLGRDYPLFTEAGHIACTPSVLPHILKHTKKVARYFLH
ncbi:hypothetical protein A3A79_02625 [Candidatus Gottesmanbacteria bacterium RIFCSPLOWO2_01_FULL_43_11b]|uniref:Inositol monophosphatase n=1 Tax=Candidatus Gottesmanbacteria bacterium RIFCSPLOWO2_01_FULL_43_11b TaxID=1798392 RepID=A0A1F6AIG3_9BACT|nr:MAG: hypothetical protein A3A79_02625 [Candidatus Gottesmanbacteria bacterium RIFCSPLOWO2_01_FULL_43_11b]